MGTIPWSAFSFNTMFFQYCNMSDLKAAYIMVALLIGSAAGGVLGGLLGDKLYDWSPGHGRPLVGAFWDRPLETAIASEAKVAGLLTCSACPSVYASVCFSCARSFSVDESLR